MQFWFQKSDREAGTAYVGAEHEGVSAFGVVRVGKRELVRAASAAGMAAMLHQMARRARAAKRAQQDARRRMDRMLGSRKDPRRSTGMNLNGPSRPGKRKRR